jgi:hypothetical protein
MAHHFFAVNPFLNIFTREARQLYSLQNKKKGFNVVLAKVLKFSFYLFGIKLKGV